MSSDKNNMAMLVLPVLEKCFDSDWNMTYAEMVADALSVAGFRQIFDGDCGLSGIKAPDDREAAEAWMRWANLAMDESVGAIGAMKQMLTELGYRKPRIIWTAEEANEMPDRAAFLTPGGIIFRKWEDYYGEGKHVWERELGQVVDVDLLDEDAHFPAEVLHEGRKS